MKPEDIKTFDDFKKYRAEEKKKRQAQKMTISEIINEAIEINDQFCKKYNITQE